MMVQLPRQKSKTSIIDGAHKSRNNFDTIIALPLGGLFLYPGPFPFPSGSQGIAAKTGSRVRKYRLKRARPSADAFRAPMASDLWGDSERFSVEHPYAPPPDGARPYCPSCFYAAQRI